MVEAVGLPWHGDGVIVVDGRARRASIDAVKRGRRGCRETSYWFLREILRGRGFSEFATRNSRRGRDEAATKIC